MAIDNNIITSPVHIHSNVARLLQTSETRSSKLCVHPRINIWSRYKPIAFSGYVFEELRDASKRDRSDTFALLNYGIKSPATAKSIAEVMDMFNSPVHSADDMYGWAYERPGFSESSHPRMSDFLGYNHKAQAPVGNFRVNGNLGNVTVKSDDGYVNMTVSLVDPATAINNILLGDIAIADWYFAALLVNASGSVVRVIADADPRTAIPLGTLGTGDNVPVLHERLLASDIGQASGTFKLYPVATSKVYVDLLSDCKWLPIPKLSPVTINFAMMTVSIRASAIRSTLTAFVLSGAILTNYDEIKTLTAYVRVKASGARLITLTVTSRYDGIEGDLSKYTMLFATPATKPVEQQTIELSDYGYYTADVDVVITCNGHTEIINITEP